MSIRIHMGFIHNRVFFLIILIWYLNYGFKFTWIILMHLQIYWSFKESVCQCKHAKISIVTVITLKSNAKFNWIQFKWNSKCLLLCIPFDPMDHSTHIQFNSIQFFCILCLKRSIHRIVLHLNCFCQLNHP